MKTSIAALTLSLSLTATAPAWAGGRDIDVEVTNLTNGTWFTPLLVAAHSRGLHLFQLATPASPHLQAMAEGGDLSGLISDVEAAGAEYVANPAGGLLAPGASATAELTVGRHDRYLSITGMLIPTNDGFVGADGIEIPVWPGVYTFELNGYDAGTEDNNEKLVDGSGAPGVLGIPADPSGHAGTGGTGIDGDDLNTTVHIHRGVVGDLDPLGGPSDLDAGIHRWQNPVARVKVTVYARRRH